MDGQKDNSISDQILAIIGEKPGLKARQIADRLSEDRKTVNDALYGRLKGKVRQDSQYRWHPVSAGAAVAHGRSKRGGSKTILAKLCGYYLDCLSQGGEDGVSVFASSRKNRSNYSNGRSNVTIGLLSVMQRWLRATSSRPTTATFLPKKLWNFRSR